MATILHQGEFAKPKVTTEKPDDCPAVQVQMCSPRSNDKINITFNSTIKKAYIPSAELWLDETKPEIRTNLNVDIRQ